MVHLNCNFNVIDSVISGVEGQMLVHKKINKLAAKIIKTNIGGWQIPWGKDVISYSPQQNYCNGKVTKSVSE